MKSYITFILLAISSLCYGDAPTNQPYFSGKIKDNRELKVDSVQVAFFENYLGGSYGLKIQTLRVDKRGKFEFRCPAITRPAQVTISLFKSGKGFLLNNYLVEPTDHVYLEITKRQENLVVKYSGAGSAKYLLIDQLVAQHERIDEDIAPLNFNQPCDKNELQLKLQKFDDIIFRAEEKKAELIYSFDSGISKPIQALIRRNYGPNFSKWDTRLHHLYSEIYAKDDSIKVLIANHYNRKKSRMCYDQVSLPTISHSDIAFLWEREKLNLYFDNNGASSKLQTFYDNLSSKYKGEFRDHLQARIFLFPRFLQHISYTNSSYDSLLTETYDRINTPYLKEILFHKFKVRKGSKLNMEEFTDLNGKPFSMKSLLGKVFLLDIWGEGCTGCALFHEKFKAISSAFEDNPEFACLSISIDKRREKWLEGIKSGDFTSKDYINVYTGGLGDNHPFLQYYKISAIPFILLVDRNGNIYEKIEVSITTGQLKDLIYRALKENSTR